MHQDEPTREMRALWATVADGTSMEGRTSWDFDTTIIPVRAPQNRLDTIRATLKNLPIIGAATELGEARDIWLRDKIGEGGMGLVYLGYQKTLDRDIAVKVLKNAHGSAEIAQREMLREAWITGRLEHPNIVPVHSMGLDENNLPILVMKRVEGAQWLDVLEGKAQRPRHYEGMDDLEMHLRILMQVCHAVHFAHQRGIIHRDIKLENVMIGEFGEVYVLDWGIALALEDDADGRLPLVEHADEIAGTPTYMAPEMTVGKGSELGIHTDVYLLGASLHTILTGKLRHEGKSLTAVMLSAYASQPVDYTNFGVPKELGDIANCAMAQRPEDRFATVDDFRQALARFLQHRTSHQLATDSEERFQKLSMWLQSPSMEQELEHVDRLFTEVRFGYEQALQIWDGNQRARDGRDVALRAMARFELERRQPVEALRLLTQMTAPDPDLKTRAETLREEVESERNRLAHLERDRDVSVGSRGRARAAAMILVLWIGSGVAQTWANPGEIGNLGFLFGDFALAAGVIYAYRESLWRNKINKEIISLVMVMLLFNILHRLFMVVGLGMTYAQSVPSERLFAGIAFAVMGLHIDRRTLFAAVVFPVAGWLCAMYPDMGWWIIFISNNIVLVLLILIWWRKPPEEANPGLGSVS